MIGIYKHRLICTGLDEVAMLLLDKSAIELASGSRSNVVIRGLHDLFFPRSKVNEVVHARERFEAPTIFILVRDPVFSTNQIVLSCRHPHARIEIAHDDRDVSLVCFAQAHFKLSPEGIL